MVAVRIKRTEIYAIIFFGKENFDPCHEPWNAPMYAASIRQKNV
jgi:hypothetical protein